MKVFFSFCFLISLNAYSSTQPDGCGSFDIYGRMEKSKTPGAFQYIVHGKTNSQYKFSLTDKQEIQMAPYLGRSSKIRASISKEITDYTGEFSEIERVEDTVPDPAFLLKNRGFLLVKKESCK